MKRIKLLVILALFLSLFLNIFFFSNMEPTLTGHATSQSEVTTSPNPCTAVSLYYDSDGDNYGNPVLEKTICAGEEIPVGYSARSNDCDDSNPSVWNLVMVYEDEDSDDFSTNQSKEVCMNNQSPNGYLLHMSESIDCNDKDKLINPGSLAIETVSSQDYNCNNKLDVDVGTIIATKKKYKGDLGGSVGADKICQHVALAQNFAGEWRALISTSKTHVSKITPDTNFVNAYQMLIADDNTILFGNWIKTEIGYNEFGTRVFDDTWTGFYSLDDYSSEINTCNDWTTSSTSIKGTTGNPSTTGRNWLAKESAYCSNPRSLYCIRHQ